MHWDGDGYNVILQALPIDACARRKRTPKAPRCRALSGQFATKNDRRKGARREK